MKSILLLPLFCVCFTSYSQIWQWAHEEPNPTGSSWTYKVVNDAAGNLYELGVYSGDFYLGGVYRTTGNGSFLAKYNTAGKLLWYRLLTPISTTYGVRINGGDIAISNDKLFVTGNYGVSNYDQYPCDNAESHFTYTFFNTTLTSAAGDLGMFFSALDLNGNVQWIKTANALRQCSRRGSIYYAPLLATDVNNNIILTFQCSMYDGFGFTLGGAFIPVGYISDPYGSQSILAVKYDNNGSLQWSNYALQKLANSNFVFTKSINTDNNGNVFINARLNDSTQFDNLMFRTTSNDAYTQQTRYPHYAASVLAKISNTGTWSFVKEIASTTNETDVNRRQNLATDNANNVYLIESVVTNCSSCGPGIILGDTLATNTTIPRQYLIKLDNTGNVQWKKSFGGLSDNYNSGFVIVNNKLYLSESIRKDATANFLFSGLTVPSTICGGVGSQPLQYVVARADTTGDFKWVATVCGTSNMIAHSIAVVGTNIYTGGSYRGAVSSLGNLNGGPSGSDNDSHFLGKLTDQYIDVGAISPLQVCAGSSIKIPFTSFGLNFSAANTFTAQMSDAAGNFATPTAIGSVVSKGSGTINGTIPTGVPFGSSYRIRIKSSDTVKTGLPYYAYADVPYKITITCITPKNLSTTNIGATTATLNWAQVSCAVGYQIQYRKKGTAAWQPVNAAANATIYNLTGLAPNTSYQWQIATVCQNSPQIVSAQSSIKTFMTASSFASKVSESKGKGGMQAILSPNPANSSATLILQGTTGKVSVSLSDLSGAILWKKTTIDKQVHIPVASLASGTYLVTVQDALNLKTLKMAKTK